MNNWNNLVPSSPLYPDQYLTSQVRERALNDAIVHADIRRSFEEYLDIFNEFYADEVEVTGDSREGEQAIRGKPRVRSMLLHFLLPLHMVAELGGLSISIQQTPIFGDVANETHSAWRLTSVAPSGNTCTLSWRSVRKWSGSRVVYERHEDYQQDGGPLSFEDFQINWP